MAYRYGKRYQRVFPPRCIDDYVSTDAPVRAYDVFVEALDINALGIHLNPHEVDNSEYDPKAMLKLLVYGYSYGLKSSRKLERETYYNLSFMWLMGGLKPDPKTISEFRRKHKREFKKTEKSKINQTDPDCSIMKGVQGSHTSYNVQSVVDEKNGLIVNTDAVDDTNDIHQFAEQVDKANKVFEQPCDVACADTGYAHTNELEKIDAQDILVIVPSKRQGQRRGKRPLNKYDLHYDKEQNCCMRMPKNDFLLVNGPLCPNLYAPGCNRNYSAPGNGRGKKISSPSSSLSWHGLPSGFVWSAPGTLSR